MAKANTFSSSEVIKSGWELTKKNFWLIVGILLIIYGVNYLISFIAGSFMEQENAGMGFVGFIFIVAGWIVGLEMSFGLISILLKIVDKKKSQVSDLFAYFDAGLLARYFLVSFLYGLMVTVGLILLVIPGIYLAIRYWFATYAYVDERKGVWASFKKSSEMTEGVKWKLFFFGILLFLIVIAGAAALVVGLLWAIPTTYFSVATAYRKLSSQVKNQ